MCNNKTAAIDINSEIFLIENDIIEEISCRANTTTIAFLDCCREENKSGMGGNNPQPSNAA
jgi:hypothetical protein